MKSKFSPLFKFELRFWRKNLATYIYTGIVLIISVLLMAGNLGVFDSNTVTYASVRFANSPYGLWRAFSNLQLLYFLIPLIVGAAINRDWSSEMHSILYSYPFKKSEYIFSKFISSFFIAFILFVTIGVGFILAHLLPGVNDDLCGPLNLLAFLKTYAVIIFPNVLLISVFIFGVVTFTRNLVSGFVTLIIFIIVSNIASSYFSSVDYKNIAAVVDPFGNIAISQATEYWDLLETNTLAIPLSKNLLINRLVWMAFSLAVFAFTYIKFNFQQNAISFNFFKRKSKVFIKSNFDVLQDVTLPKVHLDTSFSYNLKLMFSVAKFHFKYIIKSIPFWVLVGFAIFYLVVTNTFGMTFSGTPTYPTTWKMLMIPSRIFSFFILISTFLYTGMVVRRERRAKTFELVDSTQVPNWVNYFSKFVSVVYMQIFQLLIMMLTSIVLQAINGYYKFEIIHYLFEIFVLLLPYFIVWAALSLFIQSLLSNFYIGFFILFAFNISLQFFYEFGIDQSLFIFNKDYGYIYSDLNGYGWTIYSYLFYRLYWMLLAVTLLVGGLMLWRRGIKETIRIRLKKARVNLKPVLTIVFSLSLVGFFACGFYIYWFNNIENVRYSAKDREQLSVDWEKTYGKYYGIAQPRITDVNIDVDIYPEERNFSVDGKYIVINKSKQAIDSIHFNYSYRNTQVEFSRKNKLISKDTIHNYDIYELSESLMPGDSMEVRVCITNKKNHFLRKRSPILENGSFFNNMSFFDFGYTRDGELQNNTIRKKYDLPPRMRMADPTDSTQLGNTYISESADWVNFETTVSTSSDQIAIAPGYLQKKWEKDGRVYYHYKMDAPILNFYSWVSGRYEVFRDKYQDIDIEIYYNKGHEYNLQDMVDAVKASLKYYGENYSPYQHKQVRIIEFPRSIGSFAQSFPNTIPYSEAIGFIAKEDTADDGAVNYAYHVTAHEMAHQWWAHQVIGANVKGATLMSESLSEYSAIKVLEQKYSDTKIRKFMEDELDGYLRMRRWEKEKEQPLMFNENQQYIHYNKGAVAMYAISDYMGEQTLNKALSEYIATVGFQEPPYTTSLEFVDLMHKYMPDSLDYVVTDLLETITLYDNKIDSAYMSETADGKYKVDFVVSAKKYRIVDKDQQNEEGSDDDVSSIVIKLGDDWESDDNKLYVDLNDWIDLAILVEDDNKQERKLLFEKVHINQEENTFSFIVDEKPSSVSVDPYHKLIDRKLSDNSKKLKLEDSSLSKTI